VPAHLQAAERQPPLRGWPGGVAQSAGVVKGFCLTRLRRGLRGAAPVPVGFFLHAQVSLNLDAMRRFSSACSNRRHRRCSTRGRLITHHPSLGSGLLGVAKGPQGQEPSRRSRRDAVTTAFRLSPSGRRSCPVIPPARPAASGRAFAGSNVRRHVLRNPGLLPPPSSLKKSALGRFLCCSAANRGPKQSQISTRVPSSTTRLVGILK
jgi:hypothetical protein